MVVFRPDPDVEGQWITDKVDGWLGVILHVHKSPPEYLYSVTYDIKRATFHSTTSLSKAKSQCSKLLEWARKDEAHLTARGLLTRRE